MNITSSVSARRLLASAAIAGALVASLTACGDSNTTTIQTGSESSSQASVAPGGSQDGNQFGGGTSGTIAAVSGKTLQVQSQSSGQVAVTYTAKTTISQQVSATLKAVTVGSCVMVTPADSSSSDDASVTAASVRITTAQDGECSGPGGFGGGQRPSGMPTGMPSDMPSMGSDMPSDMPGDMSSGGPG